MSPKIWHTIFPEKERQYLLPSQHPALHQCLLSFGYLVVGQISFEQALQHFRKDAIQEDLLPGSTLTAPDHSTLAESLLAQKLLALEGDFPILQLPPQGAEGLAVRLLHYRLHLLGLFSSPIDRPFSGAGLQALHTLSIWLQLPADSPKLLGLLGHFLPLFHHLYQSRQLECYIVSFQFSPDQLPPDLKKEVAEERGWKDNLKKLEAQESQCESDLQKLENEILGKEQAERNRLEFRNRNKKRRLQRLSLLQKKIHRELAQLFHQHLAKQKHWEEEQATFQKEWNGKWRIVEEMKNTLAHLHHPTQKKILKAQIKAREKVLKQALKEWEQIQKKWHKERAESTQSIANKQTQIQSLQHQLKELRSQINGLRFRFKAQLRRSLEPDFFKTLEQKVFRQTDQQYLRQQHREAFNLFLIRLIQLHQWVNGYYTGRLDSQFAGKTFGSIVEMVEDIPQLRLKYVLTNLKGAHQSYWVLNVAYLFERFCKIHKETVAPDYEQILTLYQANNTNVQGFPLGPLTDDCWQEWQEERGAPIYHGRKNLWRSVGRSIYHLSQIIAKGIRIVSQLLRTFVRLLYEDIRESVVLFAQSLDFLFGKRRTVPLGENESWNIPLYQYDRDLDLAENTRAAEQHLVHHAPQANLPAQSIEQTLALLAKLAKWTIALATGSLTWPQLLLQLLLFFRKWFLRWLKQLLLERRGVLLGSLNLE